MTLIGVSAGHTSKEQGASNEKHGLTEFQVTSKIADKLVTLLGARGLRVPEGTNSQQVVWINKRAPICVVEIHLNSYTTPISGTECLYCEGSVRGRELASAIQINLLSTLGLPNRGIKVVSEGGRGWQFLSETNCPACITESLFINNDEDVERWLLASEGLDKIAQAHFEGLMSFTQGMKEVANGSTSVDLDRN